MEELVKQMGFENEKEYHKLISSVDLTDEQIMNRFLEWKENDGTKKGLLNISTIGDLKNYIMNDMLVEWWSDGYLQFIDSAEKMFKAGMEVNTIKEILNDLYTASASEFGS